MKSEYRYSFITSYLSVAMTFLYMIHLYNNSSNLWLFAGLSSVITYLLIRTNKTLESFKRLYIDQQLIVPIRLIVSLMLFINYIFSIMFLLTIIEIDLVPLDITIPLILILSILQFGAFLGLLQKLYDIIK